ncbi:hypothetical protein Prudu_1483S000100 [Prunus dulcis]|uniref:Uncharacterized protein n=1 Tax=Prunus dulcis TaxID=3755 RepID=A0A5H2YH87_PRUDU|nr:hypothetical protein Prudu_1483S000100 [Prunus dulcis]
MSYLPGFGIHYEYHQVKVEVPRGVGLAWRRLSGVETDPIRGVGCTGVWGDIRIVWYGRTWRRLSGVLTDPIRGVGCTGGRLCRNFGRKSRSLVSGPGIGDVRNSKGFISDFGKIRAGPFTYGNASLSKFHYQARDHVTGRQQTCKAWSAINIPFSLHLCSVLNFNFTRSQAHEKGLGMATGRVHDLAVRPFDFQATARPPQAEPISAVGTIGSASVSPSDLTDLHPGAALNWPKTMFSDGGSFEATRTSSSKFSFISPPNRSSTRSLTGHRRELQEVQLARTISRRSAQDPPPGHS